MYVLFFFFKREWERGLVFFIEVVYEYVDSIFIKLVIEKWNLYRNYKVWRIRENLVNICDVNFKLESIYYLLC